MTVPFLIGAMPFPKKYRFGRFQKKHQFGILQKKLKVTSDFSIHNKRKDVKRSEPLISAYQHSRTLNWYFFGNGRLPFSLHSLIHTIKSMTDKKKSSLFKWSYKYECHFRYRLTFATITWKNEEIQSTILRTLYDSWSPHKQVNNVLISIIAQNCFVQLMTLLVNKMLKMGIIDPAIVQAWVFCDDMKREFKRLVLLASNHLNIPI